MPGNRRKLRHDLTQYNYRNSILKEMGFSTYEEYLNSDHWRQIRAKAAQNPHYKKCNICGSSKNLNLHHTRYTRINGTTLANLVMLCREHHIITHQLAATKGYSLKHAVKKARQLWKKENSPPKKPDRGEKETQKAKLELARSAKRFH